MERNDTRVLLQSGKYTSLYPEKSIKLRNILKESGTNLSNFKKKIIFLIKLYSSYTYNKNVIT